MIIMSEFKVELDHSFGAVYASVPVAAAASVLVSLLQTVLIRASGSSCTVP